MCVSNLFVNRPGTDKNLVEKSLTKWEGKKKNEQQQNCGGKQGNK